MAVRQPERRSESSLGGRLRRELRLWALVSSEKLIKSETAAGGKIGGRAAEGMKERRSMREGEGEGEGASGSGPPGGSRLLLLSSLSNFPSFTPSPPSSSFHPPLPLLSPLRLRLLVSHLLLFPPFLSSFVVLLLPPSLSTLALRVRTGC